MYVFSVDFDEEDDDFGDPCHEFEHSLMFFFILGLSLTLVGTYCYLAFTK